MRPLLLLSAACLSLPLLADDHQGGELAALRASAPRLQAVRHARLGTATFLTANGGILGSPLPVQGRGVLRADAVVRTFLDAHPALCGGDRRLLDDAQVVTDAVDAHNGLRTLAWQQQVADVPVYRGRILAHVRRDGALIDLGNRFVPGDRILRQQDAARRILAATARDPAPALAQARRAVGDRSAGRPVAIAEPAQGAAARQRLVGDGLLGSARAQLVWFAEDGEVLRLSWRLLFTCRADGRMHEAVIDAADGRIHARRCLTVSEKPLPATAAKHVPAARAAVPAAAPRAAGPPISVGYQVFTGESPTPMLPGWSTPTTTQPASVPRQSLAAFASLDAGASPYGWVGTDLATRGNNVDAFLDGDFDFTADRARPQATGSPAAFTTPCDLALDPAQNADAAIVNVFYWMNRYHDLMYGYGFTEAAGNFQDANASSQGLGGDAIRALVQCDYAADNAFFATPPDGEQPYAAMGVFHGAAPARDASLDATIILHECTHGLSNRLIGDGYGLNAPQSLALGEGWSDFYALALLSDPSAAADGCYPIGAYAIYDGASANYFSGLRRYPYVHEAGAPTLNPLTFSDLPLHPEAHDAGEVWCQTLWDARARLIASHGPGPGNQLILQLATDGMKLLSAIENPDFLDARDAILHADLLLNGGSHQADLWAAFARRGMGADALTADHAGMSWISASFDLPGTFQVAPHRSISAAGNPGGPFSISGTAHTITNAGSDALAWTAQADQPWISVQPASGTLAAGASVTVDIGIGSAAETLATGSVNGTVTFTDTSHGQVSLRPVTLLVESAYQVAEEAAAWINPATHNDLLLGDDDAAYGMPLPFPVTFYDHDYTSLHIGSNGLICFRSGDDIARTQHHSIPDTTAPNAIVCALLNDLDPSAGGTVRLGSLGAAPNRKAVISWVDVPYFDMAGTKSSVQIVLSEGSPDILVNYKRVDAADAANCGLGIEDASGIMGCRPNHLPANGRALRYSPNRRPTVATTATPAQATVTGTAVALTALGTDDHGAQTLTYTWSMVSAPAGSSVSWTPNGTLAAQASTATFTRAGTYLLRCTIQDQGGLQSATDTTVTVVQTASSVRVLPDPLVIALDGIQAFTASEQDQFGQAMAGAPPGFAWSISSSASGSIDPTTGVFAANGTHGGPYLVTASANGISGSAHLTVGSASGETGGGGGGGGGGGCGAGTAALVLLGLLGLRRRP